MDMIAEQIIKKIEQIGVSAIFLVPGAYLSSLVSALMANGKIKPIVATHETSAGFMADGYARVSENMGVCMAIAGPGAMNLIPATASAYADRTPILVLTGCMPSLFESRGAFQDSSSAGENDVALFSYITSSSAVVTHINNVVQQLQHALHFLFSYNCPVYLQVPIDIQKAYAPFSEIKLPIRKTAILDLEALVHLGKKYFTRHEKIIILAGSGMNRASHSVTLKNFSEQFQIPVATTLCAKGCMPEDHHLSLGVFGFGGNPRAHQAILSEEKKLLILIGVDVNQRNSLSWSPKIKAYCEIVQIDVRSEYIGKNYPIDMGIMSDGKALLEYISAESYSFNKNLLLSCESRKKWVECLNNVEKYCPVEKSELNEFLIHPIQVIQALRKVMPRNTILAVDSGLHRIFMAHYWSAYGAQQYLTSINNAPMGWAIGAGIGAKLAKPDASCVVITGDGCMLMHGNEIQTAQRYHLPIIFLIFNNRSYASVPTSMELPNYNWAQYATAFKLKAFNVYEAAKLKEIFHQALMLNEPCVIDIECTIPTSIPNEDYLNEQNGLKIKNSLSLES